MPNAFQELGRLLPWRMAKHRFESTLAECLLTSNTSDRRCEFCQFPLENKTAGSNDSDGDKYKLNFWIEQAGCPFLVETIMESGRRGCLVCAAICEALLEDFPTLSMKGTLMWSRHDESLQDSTDRGIVSRKHITYRLFNLANNHIGAYSSGMWPNTSIRYQSAHQYVEAHPNPFGAIDIQSCTSLPTRILKISKNRDRNLRIRLFESKGRVGKYMCLSHCCGDSRPDCITTSKTLRSNQKGIPWDSLTKTFQDAILLCHELGMKYIWIDSICIVQDDELDWREEAAKMHDIYRNSNLTIMATKSANGHGGLFLSQPPFKDRQLPVTIDGEPIFLRQLSDTYVPWKDTRWPQGEYSLCTRAWAFQERFLSPRAVHFTLKGMYYECMEGAQSDCVYIRGWERSQYPKSFELCKSPFVWRRVVQRYSGLEMTLPKDKLPAIAGVAKYFALANHKDSSSHSGEYFAGLWEKSIATDMTWHCQWPAKRPVQWRAPSWSWASLQGAIEYSEVYCGLKLLHCRCRPKGPDQFGELMEAEMKVSTRLLSGIFMYKKKRRYYERDKYRIHLLSGSFELLPDYDFFENGENLVPNGSKVSCLPIYETRYQSDRLQSCLALQSVDHSTATYQRIGVIEFYEFRRKNYEDVIQAEFEALEEVVITII